LFCGAISPEDFVAKSKKTPKPRRETRSKAASAVPKAKHNGKAAGVLKRKGVLRRKALKAPVQAKMNSRTVAKGGSVVPMEPLKPPVRPIKNLAGLKARDLEFFREALLAKRRELLGDVSSMEEEALRNGGDSNLSNLPIHMADMGTDNYEQEFTLNLVQKDRDLLNLINTALGKIRNGTYGMCEGTSKPISRARLEAQPWAKHSIEYARQVEKGLVRG
jgi:RNA polymerase-binding protein DksA